MAAQDSLFKIPLNCPVQAACPCTLSDDARSISLAASLMHFALERLSHPDSYCQGFTLSSPLSSLLIRPGSRESCDLETLPSILEGTLSNTRLKALPLDEMNLRIENSPHKLVGRATVLPLA